MQSRLINRVNRVTYHVQSCYGLFACGPLDQLIALTLVCLFNILIHCLSSRPLLCFAFLLTLSFFLFLHLGGILHIQLKAEESHIVNERYLCSQKNVIVFCVCIF